MTMLTMFTIPKPFRGNIDIIQQNAIRSWVRLGPACEIILFGNDEGTAEIAGQLGIRHIPQVECNEYGTPLLSSVFRLADNIASHNLMCFINADIILTSDFLPALQHVQFKRFLIVGLRWDLEVNELINFEDRQWEHILRNRLAERGRLHPPGGGGDYFIFPRGFFGEIPPFAIGRTAWDNWLIYRARALKAHVVDATRAFLNVHQNHDYSHHPEGTPGVWKGPESQRNRELMGGEDNYFTTDYATDLLTPGNLKPALTLRHIYFRLRALPILHPAFHFLLAPFKAFEKLAGLARSSG